MLVRNSMRAARPMSVAAALLAILFATPATAPAAPSAPCSADCSDSTAEAGEPSTDLPTTDLPGTDLPAIDEPDVPDAPSTDDDSDTGTDTEPETGGDDGSGSVVVPTPPETGDGGDDDDADIGGGIGGIGGIGGGGGDSGTGGGTGSTDSGTGDFGESARVTITNDPDDNPVIRPDRPTPDAPAANAPSASGPQDSTAGVPVAPSLPGTSPNRATPKPPTSDRDRAPATATEVPVEPAVTTAAPSLTSQDFAAAGTGIAGLILIAGAAGAMTYRNARAGRVRVNAARAEFLSPGGR